MRIPVALLLVLAGCAGGGEANLNPSPTPNRVISSPSGAYVALSDDSGAREAVLPGTPDALWPALQEVYAELGIPVTEVDAAQRVLGNSAVVVTRGVERLSRSQLMDCGNDLTGSVADQSRLRLAVHSGLAPVAAGTRLQTRVTGTARKNSGSSGDELACRSTGRLEAEIAQRLAGRAGG